MNKTQQKIFNKVAIVPDFPTRGISFKDITPIFADPKIFKLTIKELAKLVKGHKFDVVCGLESRGFWFALPLANELGLPFVPIRKKGKLPRKTVSATYTLEYGKDAIEVHKQDIKPGARVLVVDDIVATGGTILATAELMKKLHAKFEHVLLLGYLEEIPQGIEKIEQLGIKVHTLLKF